MVMTHKMAMAKIIAIIKIVVEMASMIIEDTETAGKEIVATRVQIVTPIPVQVQLPPVHIPAPALQVDGSRLVRALVLAEEKWKMRMKETTMGHQVDRTNQSIQNVRESEMMIR
jgi:hypothetical protein